MPKRKQSGNENRYKKRTPKRHTLKLAPHPRVHLNAPRRHARNLTRIGDTSTPLTRAHRSNAVSSLTQRQRTLMINKLARDTTRPNSRVMSRGRLIHISDGRLKRMNTQHSARLSLIKHKIAENSKYLYVDSENLSLTQISTLEALNNFAISRLSNVDRQQLNLLSRMNTQRVKRNRVRFQTALNDPAAELVIDGRYSLAELSQLVQLVGPDHKLLLQVGDRIKTLSEANKNVVARQLVQAANGEEFFDPDSATQQITHSANGANVTMFHAGLQVGQQANRQGAFFDHWLKLGSNLSFQLLKLTLRKMQIASHEDDNPQFAKTDMKFFQKNCLVYAIHQYFEDNQLNQDERKIQQTYAQWVAEDVTSKANFVCSHLSHVNIRHLQALCNALHVNINVTVHYDKARTRTKLLHYKCKTAEDHETLPTIPIGLVNLVNNHFFLITSTPFTRCAVNHIDKWPDLTGHVHELNAMTRYDPTYRSMRFDYNAKTVNTYQLITILWTRADKDQIFKPFTQDSVRADIHSIKAGKLPLGTITNLNPKDFPQVKLVSFHGSDDSDEFVKIAKGSHINFKHPRLKVLAADCEAQVNDGRHKAYAVAWKQIRHRPNLLNTHFETNILRGQYCVKNFLSTLSNRFFYIIYFHNLGYDFQFILKWCTVISNPLKKGSSLKSCVLTFHDKAFGNNSGVKAKPIVIILKDSFPLLPLPLAKLPVSFHLFFCKNKKCRRFGKVLAASPEQKQSKMCNTCKRKTLTLGKKESYPYSLYEYLMWSYEKHRAIHKHKQGPNFYAKDADIVDDYISIARGEDSLRDQATSPEDLQNRIQAFHQSIQFWDCLNPNEDTTLSMRNRTFNHDKFCEIYTKCDVDILALSIEQFQLANDSMRDTLHIPQFCVLNCLSTSNYAETLFNCAGCYGKPYDPNGDKKDELNTNAVCYVSGVVREMLSRYMRNGGQTMCARNLMYHVQSQTDCVEANDATSLYPKAQIRLEEIGGCIAGSSHIIDVARVDHTNLFQQNWTAFFVFVKITSVGIRLDFPILNYKDQTGCRVYNAEDCVGRVIGFSHIRLSNVIEFHDATFELIQGIYWNSGRVPGVGRITQTIFDKRAELKGQGNPLQGVYKLVLNGYSGIQGLNPIEYKYMVTKVPKEGKTDQQFQRALRSKIKSIAYRNMNQLEQN